MLWIRAASAVHLPINVISEFARFQHRFDSENTRPVCDAWLCELVIMFSKLPAFSDDDVDLTDLFAEDSGSAGAISPDSASASSDADYSIMLLHSALNTIHDLSVKVSADSMAAVASSLMKGRLDLPAPHVVRTHLMNSGSFPSHSQRSKGLSLHAPGSVGTGAANHEALQPDQYSIMAASSTNVVVARKEFLRFAGSSLSEAPSSAPNTGATDHNMWQRADFFTFASSPSTENLHSISPTAKHLDQLADAQGFAAPPPSAARPTLAETAVLPHVNSSVVSDATTVDNAAPADLTQTRKSNQPHERAWSPIKIDMSEFPSNPLVPVGETKTIEIGQISKLCIAALKVRENPKWH